MREGSAKRAEFYSNSMARTSEPKPARKLPSNSESDMPPALMGPGRDAGAQRSRCGAEPIGRGHVNRVTVTRRSERSNETIRAHQQSPRNPSQAAHESAGILVAHRCYTKRRFALRKRSHHAQAGARVTASGAYRRHSARACARGRLRGRFISQKSEPEALYEL